MLKNFKLAVVVMLAGILLTGCGNKPESTVENFYRALAKGEVTEAKGYLSKQLVGMVGDAKLTSALTSEAASMSKCGGIVGIDIKLQGEGEVRTGTAVVTFSNAECKPKTANTKLVKEDGRWKISPNK